MHLRRFAWKVCGNAQSVPFVMLFIEPFFCTPNSLNRIHFVSSKCQQNKLYAVLKLKESASSCAIE